eukprot:CAMPEP_0113905282 /NCGR_PEP_ID=MMETSP0780_2-20120614/23895_1 /TAXON_ID=652834 /ORGANISM="Palpitomonas bilix" /LENGTH=177 /DNA_ID=CAMNT_0000899333 /DNA_START=513 /DNA_END=1046 /DNA_ORIENTATION=+ /assembly_acc=CAM_ASM_000599
MIFGIIIDTFGELRAERDEIKDDIVGNCFICSVEASIFDRKSRTGDYAYHIKYEHHMWDYLAFFVYLQEKDKNDYTGMESYVAELVANKDEAWVPNGAALCLSPVPTAVEEKNGSSQPDERGEEKTYAKRIEALETVVADLAGKWNEGHAKSLDQIVETRAAIERLAAKIPLQSDEA